MVLAVFFLSVILRKNSSITIIKIAKTIGKTTRTIESQLHRLQLEGKIERVGSDKSGHWRILQ